MPARDALNSCAASESGAAPPIPSHPRERTAASVAPSLDMVATACAQAEFAVHPIGWSGGPELRNDPLISSYLSFLNNHK